MTGWNTLDKLGRRYGTDKASGGHNYLWFYEKFLEPLRDKPLRLLEIGVGDGASMRMWADYFQNAETLVGFDIEPEKVKYANDRIRIEIGNQRERGDLERLIANYGPFDFVLDDACHEGPAQLISYQTIMPDVIDGGLYIIEDLIQVEMVDRALAAAGQILPDDDRRDPLCKWLATFKGTVIFGK